MCDISEYMITERDYLIYNPYLFEIDRIRKELPGGADLKIELAKNRTELVSKYSFSIPTADDIDVIAKFSPLVEIGAGSGYWAMCLRQAGADIIAYDRFPPEQVPPSPWGDWQDRNYWFESEWSTVSEGSAEAAGLHPDRSLFLCWPMFGSPMALDALEAYKRAGGRTLIYIGDRGSSGDEMFFRRLEEMKLKAKIKRANWPGISENLEIYDL
jgi:hypothetical protein